MPAGILAVIMWIVNNPQILLQGEQVVVALIQDAIKLWQSFQTKGQTEEQLLAGWTALGIDMQAVRDDWRSRHPVA